MDNFQRILRFTSVLDKELGYIHKNSTLAPARYSLFLLKLLTDGLWNTIHILKTIENEEHPDSLQLYTTYPIGSIHGRYVFTNEESLFASVLIMPGWNCPVKIIQKKLPENGDQDVLSLKKSVFSRFRDWVKEQELFFNLGLIGKREGIGSAAVALFYYITHLHRTPVLIYNSGYNWDDTILELYHRGMCPAYRLTDEIIDQSDTAVRNYYDEVYKVCSVHPDLKEFEEILGIEVSSIFFDRVSRIIGEAFGKSMYTYDLTREIIQQKKIRGLLHSVRSRPMGHAIVQAARDEHIPVVSWQHGGAGYCYNPIMPFIEFINSDWHFVFGRGVEENYRLTVERLGLEKNPCFIAVGSSSLDAFRRNTERLRRKNKGETIVYITSAYLQNLYTIPHPFDPSDFDEHLWQIQREILNLAGKNPGKNFIMKFHPSQKNLSPVNDYIGDKGIKNVKIITSEMTVQELTGIADIVIMDLISTAILQVLTTDVPVFVYSELLENDPGIIRALKKRVYVSDKMEDFVMHIGEYLQNRRVSGYPVDFTNDDFLRDYGADIHANNSAEKAVKKLAEIMR